MIQSKKIDILAIVMICFALIVSALFIRASGNSTLLQQAEPEYRTSIFGADVISIDIIAEESDWQEMIAHAVSEEFIMADVIVNGTKFRNVGIRPKGNSSLTQVAQEGDSSRYSFRLQFDQYVEDQTCFGLDSFVVNNIQGDHTYMKEYMSYELMEKMGVDAPCFGYADIKVNGENHGLYLAVETYGDSYEERTFGTVTGMLYNVKSMEMGGEMGGSRSGGTLEYSDDSSASYGAIFENAVGKGSEADYQKVIKALKALSEGENLEQYFDVDQILRYLAVHTIVVNLDSYSSDMAQNYYIYEEDGQVTILPWDYNLAWGGFQSGSLESVINFPIDTPVSGVSMSERPLLEQLLSNPDYLKRYHSYVEQMMTTCFADGKWEVRVAELNGLIADYVKNDSTAFCTYEEYQKAVDAFSELGRLRYESIKGQLEGTIPSTTETQSAEPGKLIQAGDLELTDLGSSMGGEGAGKGMGTHTPDNGRRSPVNAESGAIEAAGFTEAEPPARPAEKGDQPDGTGGSPDGMHEQAGDQADPAYILLIGCCSAVLAMAILAAARLKRTY